MNRVAGRKWRRGRIGSPSRASGGRRGRSHECRGKLVALFKEVSSCQKCPLWETRTKTVFGAGNADADLMFVGEAPGAEEDKQGLPFVGRAGQLLNELLVEIGLSREDVFICNVLKSRPPNNRDPQPEEIAACEPYLWEQVRLIQPRVVCTLGNFATKLLTGSQTGITKVRGTPQTHELGGRPVYLLPLFHPAAALRTPAVKEQLRGDFATIPALLQQALPEGMPSADEVAKAESEERGGEGGSTPPPPADQLGFFGEPGS
jgi:uracil-DNA glycosylase